MLADHDSHVTPQPRDLASPNPPVTAKCVEFYAKPCPRLVGTVIAMVGRRDASM